jgi:beta-glucosidase
MKPKKLFSLLPLFVLLCTLPTISSALWAQAQEGAGAPQLGKASIGDVISAMTLEEKAKLVVGAGRAFGPQNSQAERPPELVAGAAGTTAAIPRLGIPAIVVADGPAGLRIRPTRENDSKTYYCTAFPIETLLASSWDPDLVREVGRAMGNEVLEYGVDVLLGPALNIHRNPLCGRNFEYYSEDPLITGEMAAAMVNGVQSNGVGTSIKHFVANNEEWNRNTINELITQRALREIYLRGFRLAVQGAQPWTVMSSYNKVNGTYTSERYDLLTEVLREDWGFLGLVMTDWFGGTDPIAQMKAGNDLLMPGVPNQEAAIVKAVQEGQLDEHALDRNVERLLKLVVKSPRFRQYKYSDKPDLAAHAEVVRQAASESMVLLKNAGQTLPINSGVKSLAVFGNNSYDTVIGGTGSGDVNEKYSISIVQGLEDSGFSVDGSLAQIYRTYIDEARAKLPKPRFGFMPRGPIAEMALDPGVVSDQAGKADAAILTIGRNSGEGRDREVEGDFDLTATEQANLEAVSDAFHAQGKKVIVLLNIGGVIETPSWRDMPDAILLAWQPGEEAGHSVADVLTGKVNPSGRLASTFPMKYSDVPSAKYFPGKELEAEQPSGEQRAFRRGRPAEVTYGEDIYVGYRYYDTFDVPVAYEFGYGLSYTKFDFSNLKVERDASDGSLKVAVDVRNSGDVSGKEVVEVYLSAPKGRLERPERELIGFAKTQQLDPGKTATVQLSIDRSRLAAFDTEASSWVTEAGTYTVRVGASSKDIRQTGTFSVTKAMTLQWVSEALAPPAPIQTMKP